MLHITPVPISPLSRLDYRGHNAPTPTSTEGERYVGLSRFVQRNRQCTSQARYSWIPA